MDNKLIQAIANKQTVYGLWGRIPSLMVSEILSQTGVDFVAADMEHGAIDIADLRTMVPVYKAAGITILLRIDSPGASYISKALDLGIDGIIVPQVRTALEAKQAVSASKFAPLGKRGLGGACQADHFGDVNVEEFIIQENKRVLTIIQIENVEALEQLDEILKVEGIDMLYIGPFDLSVSLGCTGQMSHPKLIQSMQVVINKAKSFGIPIGMHGADQEFIRFWREQGVSLFTFGMDSAIFKQSVSSAVKSLGK
jgi:2-keto-3-deoxy-L-rhamnonate aldolase RhmA